MSNKNDDLNSLIARLLGSAMLIGLMGSPAMAQEEPAPADEMMMEEEETDEGTKFLDRDLLADTFGLDDQLSEEDELAKMALQTELDDLLAISEMDRTEEQKMRITEIEDELASFDLAAIAGPLQGELDELLAIPEGDRTEEQNMRITDLQEQLDGIGTETETVAELIDQLSDDEVVWLNRALNNQRNAKWLAELDSDLLQQILDNDYDWQDINALTKAYEEEAKFDYLATRFEDRAESTGNDKFLDLAERTRVRGETQRDKFLGKVTADEAADEASEEASEAAAEETKLAVRTLSKGQAKQEARDAAKGAAKNAAKREAKQQAKDEAKKAAKDKARGRNS